MRSIVVVRAYRGSEGFFFRLVVLIGKQFELSAAGALSFLAADPGNLLLSRGTGSLYFCLDFIQQDSSSQKTIESLRALSLALHPNAGGAMVEHNTGGDLVDFLTAGPRRANKLFVNVLLPNPQGLHAL